jgi:SAM-dependent methyltransferase
VSEYFIKPGYTPRLEPDYFVDDDLNAVWQPDLYEEAAAVARHTGACKIVDVGCGTAAKLVPLHPEFEIVGIDYGTNIDRARERYPFGTWIDADLDESGESLYEGTDAAVLVCGDVIEHLVHPERLLQGLRHGLDAGAHALLLTTPDRELISGVDHAGPPENPAHVREWSSLELADFMASMGLHGQFGLTRSNDVMPYMRTILAVVPGSPGSVEDAVDQWWAQRAKWERLAVEQDRLIASQDAWIKELDAAKQWLEDQNASRQPQAE